MKLQTKQRVRYRASGLCVREREREVKMMDNIYIKDRERGNEVRPHGHVEKETNYRDVRREEGRTYGR